MSNIQVFFPSGMFGSTANDTELDTLLRRIEVKYRKGEFEHHIETDDFMFHPYCWCEKEECLWCGGCKCPAEVEYYLDGNRVDDWDKENRRILTAPLPFKVAKHGTPEYDAADKAWNACIEERNRRLKTVYCAVTHTCLPEGMMENCERTEKSNLERIPSNTAPNFWHKKTGFKVWWYKWIARDTQTNRPVTAAELESVAELCE